jgi:hypothetical protein
MLGAAQAQVSVFNLPPWLSREDFDARFLALEGALSAELGFQGEGLVGSITFSRFGTRRGRERRARAPAPRCLTARPPLPGRSREAAESAALQFNGWIGWGSPGLVVELAPSSQQQPSAGMKRGREDAGDSWAKAPRAGRRTRLLCAPPAPGSTPPPGPARPCPALPCPARARPAAMAAPPGSSRRCSPPPPPGWRPVQQQPRRSPSLSPAPHQAPHLSDTSRL